MDTLEVEQLSKAIALIAEEKGLEPQVVHDVVEEAILAAFRRDYGGGEVEMTAHFDANNNRIKIDVEKEVVDEVIEEGAEITLKDAQAIDKDAKLGETVTVTVEPKTFGRVASQTAKQVILQKLREIEREAVMGEYADKVGSMLNGVVQKVDRSVVYVDLGKATGIMPGREQIRGEFMSVGARIKVYLKEVDKEGRTPQLILSRACPEFIQELFESEVPEIGNGSVEIKGIAREAGARTKIAVESNVPGVDAVGTFVGSHGIRVQAVQSEVGDREKIDIVQWSDDTKQFIMNAMSPTEIQKVEINESDKTAKVFVAEDQVSVAIGRAGQNIRLASRLTGYEITVERTDGVSTEVGKRPADGAAQEDISDSPRPQVAAEPRPERQKRPASKAQIEESLLGAIESADSDDDESDDDAEKTDS